MLSRHKYVQNKVFDEILDVVGCDKSSPITYSKLQSLRYLDAVIKESFRIHPPVSMIGRYVDHDIKLG